MEASLLNVCDKVPSNVAFLGGPVMPNQLALLLVWVCEARRPADFVRFAHIGKRTWRQAFSTRVIFTHILLFDPRGFLFSTALILRIPDHEQVKGHAMEKSSNGTISFASSSLWCFLFAPEVIRFDASDAVPSKQRDSSFFVSLSCTQMPWHLQILLRPVPCLSTNGAT